MPTTDFWTKALAEARELSPQELRRHASVSTDNRHQCEDCFTCACAAVLREKRAARRYRLEES